MKYSRLFSHFQERDRKNFVNWLNKIHSKDFSSLYEEQLLVLDEHCEHNTLILDSNDANQHSEKIFLSDLFPSFSSNKLKSIPLPYDITEHLWLSSLKLHDFQYAPTNYRFEYCAQKHTLLMDNVFLSAFTHDLMHTNNLATHCADCTYEGDKYPPYHYSFYCAEMNITISDTGIDALKQYGLTEDTIQDITKRVATISNYNSFYARVSALPHALVLLKHLTPLIIFIAANLPLNEVAGLNNVLRPEGTFPTYEKYLNIVFAACESLLPLKDLLGKDNYPCQDLESIQRNFLLASLDEKEPLKKALTNRTNKISQKYNHFNTHQLLSRDLTVDSSGFSTIEVKGDINDICWLLSTVPTKNASKTLALFQTLLDSVNIFCSEHKKSFKFNKTINLIMFNQLTRLIEVAFMHPVAFFNPPFELYIDGLLCKHAFSSSGYFYNSSETEEVSRLNLISASMFSSMYKELSKIPSRINLDPYDDYLTILESQVPPRPRPKMIDGADK